MAIRIGGLASGIDTDSIIKEALKGERTKIDTQYQKKQILEWKRDSYRDSNTKLLALRNSILDLKLDNTYNSKKVDCSDEKVLTATAASDVENGTHIIKVNSLLSGVTKISTSELADYKDTLQEQFGLAAGTTISFTLKGKDGVSHNYSFNVDTKSINDVVNEINANAAASGINVGYSAEGKRFIMSTADKGKDAVIEVEADADNFLKDTLKLGVDVATYNGTNASIDYDGAAGIEFSSNQFTLNNIKFDLKKAGETVSINISANIDTAVEKIKTFIEAYNGVMDNINTKLNERRELDSSKKIKYPPLTDEQRAEMSESQIEKWEAKAKLGVMYNEALIQNTGRKVRQTANNMLIDSVSADNITNPANLVENLRYKSLSSIGINTETYLANSKENGKLYIQESVLREALQDHPEDVMKLFNLQQTEMVNGRPVVHDIGIALKMYTTANNCISDLTGKAGLAESYYDNSTLSREINQVGERILSMEERMEEMENRYWKQFSAMEQAIQKLTVQGQYLQQKLASLNTSSQ